MYNKLKKNKNKFVTQSQIVKIIYKYQQPYLRAK